VAALGPVSDTTSYEWLVTDLLHDPLFVRWTQAQIDAYINQARKQVVKDTGCLRTLQQSYISTGRTFYPFGQVGGASIVTPGSGYVAPTLSFTGGGGAGAAATATVSGGQIATVSFSSYGAGYETAPNVVIADASGTGASILAGVCSIVTYDVLSITAYWGTQKYQLNWLAFREFAAAYRPYTDQAYQRMPAAWAAYGQNTFVIAPSPDQTYQIELDTVVFPDILAGATQDIIPANMQDPVPYYAAYLAKRNAKSFAESESFLEDYRRLVQEACGSYIGRVPNAYPVVR
jgi:hypothetical protein